jgi:hypothetical protein
MSHLQVRSDPVAIVSPELLEIPKRDTQIVVVIATVIAVLTVIAIATVIAARPRIRRRPIQIPNSHR